MWRSPAPAPEEESADARFVEVVRPVPELPGSLDEAELTAPAEVTANNRRLVVEFTPASYRGDLLLFTTARLPDAPVPARFLAAVRRRARRP
ncbi:hypothetical protein [Streptomyces cellulosae]|uniref:hypothetical protein n=1 Tax=Streptomyces cellulosae TaxID=1968 RepID=UPI00131DE65E|nr:hypothetical protein [Streptomyces cellulosae]